MKYAWPYDAVGFFFAGFMALVACSATPEETPTGAAASASNSTGASTPGHSKSSGSAGSTALGPDTCGTAWQPCCSGECTDGSYCLGNQCWACGEPGETCCPSGSGIAPCDPSVANLACTSGSCQVTCGATGDTCCSGSTPCTDSRDTCGTDGICHLTEPNSCGGLEQACCNLEAPCKGDPNLACISGYCTGCGDLGDFCCNNDGTLTCDGAYHCAGDSRCHE